MTRRRRREVVTRADGTQHKITGLPRADVLHYPASNLTTVLVRRTHDVAAARVLADERWAQLRADGLVDDELGVDPDRCVRVGWWTTVPGRRTHDRQAVDMQGRLVTACWDKDTGAGPGVEFRP